MSFRPSTFTWYCFLNLGFKTCPWYDLYDWTESLLLRLEIWLFVSLWIVSVLIITQSLIMHPISLWQWGFAGSCVLCKIHFAFFIEHLIAFVISSSWQTVLTLCCQPCHFLFFDVLSFLLCAAAASWLSAMQCLFIFSLIIFLHVAATSILSALRHLFLYCLSVILHFADSSILSALQHLFIYILCWLSCTLQLRLCLQPGALSSYCARSCPAKPSFFCCHVELLLWLFLSCGTCR